MTEPAIRARDLTRTFKAESGTITALDQLSLEIERGKIFGFLGPNGAGKTTTVRLLLGLIEPTAGDAVVLGFDVRSAADQIRSRSGALLEHDGLYERLTAFDNLDFYGRIWRLPRAERCRRAQELLERFGLWQRRTDAVGEWSRGMKRKLALARTLLHRPELIFLDEPTAGLDPGAAAALRDDLAGLAGPERATIFLNTHNLAEAEKLCDRIGVIANGKLAAVGPPVELRREFQGQRVEIGGYGFRDEWQTQLKQLAAVAEASIRENTIDIRLQNGAVVAPIVRWIVEHGGAIEEVRRGHATLEDVYLQLIAGES